MRMAGRALAKQYGKDIAHTGPIFSGYRVDGSEVTVTFEKESLSGGLVVGSKGMAKDYREPGKYVEPAKATPGEALNHFRLCGADRKWHAAELEIYAASLPGTYGLRRVPFYYAQPAASLVQGITAPDIPDAKGVPFDQWPKGLKAIATGLATLARQ